MTLLEILDGAYVGLFRREGYDRTPHEVCSTPWEDTRVIRWATDRGPHPVMYHHRDGYWEDNAGDRLDSEYDPENDYDLI